MLNYNSRDWYGHLFDVEGSMIREIFARVATVTIWSAMVVVIHRNVYRIEFPSLIHTLLGFALSLLLVFRTNSSYDRFWEGRRQWGAIINTTRNLARDSKVHLTEAPDLHERILLWTIAFTISLRHALRGERGLGSLADRLPPEEVREVLAAGHVPLAVTVKISEALNEARKRGVISEIMFPHIDRHVGEMVDEMGACERIHTTPLPFVYMVHIRRALILYAGGLPFVLVGSLGWLTVPSTFAVGYFLFGIEEIGVEIEDPFGEDVNDLPLEKYCGTVKGNLLELLEKREGDAETAGMAAPVQG